MNNEVLMIAFHYPPFSGSSGVQRTLRFVQYLPDQGWEPVVLTANQRAYEQISNSHVNGGSATNVYRAFALDTARHLSFKGRYIDWMAIPDRWASWILGAIPAAIFTMIKHKPAIIWSTYPIASAHYVGWILHKITGKPWVADFRDPMVEQNVRTAAWAPAKSSIRKARLWIEEKAVKCADKLVFCTEGARKICVERYPDADHSNWLVISNGYDEDAFKQAYDVHAQQLGSEKSTSKITLLHSGILYNSLDRDPSHFLKAIAFLKSNKKITAESLHIILRASGFEDIYREKIQTLGIADIVSLQPSISYKNALQEMLTVDGLLIFQGYTSNPAIPAKAYEYLRARKPILSLVDKDGDTAKLMAKAGMTYIAPLDNVEAISACVEGFLNALNNDEIIPASDDFISNYSRKSLTGELASVFNEVIDKQ